MAISRPLTDYGIRNNIKDFFLSPVISTRHVHTAFDQGLRENRERRLIQCGIASVPDRIYSAKRWALCAPTLASGLFINLILASPSDLFCAPIAVAVVILFSCKISFLVVYLGGASEKIDSHSALSDIKYCFLTKSTYPRRSETFCTNKRIGLSFLDVLLDLLLNTFLGRYLK